MRARLSRTLIRLLAPVGLLGGSAWLVQSSDGPQYTEQDKAYYADANLINFVRPGLALKIRSADVAADGTISVRFTLADPKGLPLDREGITTPGPITLSFIAAHIPKGQTQYTAYTTANRVLNGPNGPVTRTLPAPDAGGTYEKLNDGEYRYTFATKAPADYDRTTTHTIGVTARRDLTEFELDRQFDNDVYTFVPDGSKVTVVRDIVRTDTCNKRCHDPLAVHGGNRRKVELCILCHQQQNMDAVGNSLSFPVFIHKIHRGSSLPSVKAGKPYQIMLSRPVDFSDVVFPANVINCVVCHDPNSGAAQADAWLKPNRAACGACHDDVNFATGEGHVNLPQLSDNQCGNCHIPQGELEFDASIKGAHLEPRFSRDLPGTTFAILNVTDGVAGKRPTVAFTIKDKNGNPEDPSKMGYLALVMAGPTTDYQWAITEDVRKAQGTQDGTYFWTFQKPIADDAKGTFSMSIEGFANVTLMPGTKQERTVRDAGVNKTVYFSVDGSKVEPRREVVAIEKCNACHYKFQMHGGSRNRIEHCVQCHNVNATDADQRPDSEMPAQVITFKTMIHRIHTGEDLDIEYTIYGHNHSKHDMTEVVFPGDRRDCQKCHINGSEQLPLKDNLQPVVNPRGLYTPMGPTAAACLGCHTDPDCFAHAYSMTTPIGEACAACHGKDSEFSVNRVHAR